MLVTSDELTAVLREFAQTLDSRQQDRTMPTKVGKHLRELGEWLEIAKLSPVQSEASCARYTEACFAGADAIDALTTLRADVARLDADCMTWECREAAVCPEDVGFEEAIATLRAEHAKLKGERDALLLDRHRRDGISPCGHYRVFAMPQVHEDGSETPYCMQCDRDWLQCDRDSLQAENARLQEEIARGKR